MPEKRTRIRDLRAIILQMNRDINDLYEGLLPLAKVSYHNNLEEMEIYGKVKAVDVLRSRYLCEKFRPKVKVESVNANGEDIIEYK